MQETAQYWIEALSLTTHPEGGYFRETYRSGLSVSREALPPKFNGDRAVCTAIHFLLQGHDFSAFHRLRSDELWHFYSGTTLNVHVIDPDGSYSEIRLGPNIQSGEAFQAIVRAGCWFASRVKDLASFALVGCTVAPGFDFEDFEIARRTDLIRCFPQHRQLIESFTRN